MATINETFGQLQGPFNAGENVLSNILNEDSPNYISKLGVHYLGNYDLDLQGNREGNQFFITINNDNVFQIGKTRMLELQGVEIRSLKFNQDMNESTFVDYLYAEIEQDDDDDDDDPIIVSVQSDWNQNDENANDYIKNRPFYTSNQMIELIPEVSDFGPGPYNYYNEDGGRAFNIIKHDNSTIKRFNAIIDGTTYEIVFTPSSYSYTNDRYSATVNLENEKQISFSIYKDDGYEIQSNNIENQISISVISNQPNIIKINEKYIPFSIKSGSGADSILLSNALTASGEASIAEGLSTRALGDYSHAEGINTNANHRSQHTFGEYNIADSSTTTKSERGNYVEIVGNGTANNARSNARTLDWSGNESLAGSLTLGTGTADEVTITPAQLKQLLNLLVN